MKALIAAMCLAVLALPAQAQDKKEPSPAQKKQQERMKMCNEKAGDRKGDERKGFMSSCLKGEMDKKGGSAQQQRMKDCNAQASAKGMKGDERKKFMSGCLKG